MDARIDRLTIEAQAEVAFEKIIALRELTAQTGTVTVKSQNDVLQSLPNPVLTLVATKLRRAQLPAKPSPRF